jgi:hypothetical protein
MLPRTILASISFISAIYADDTLFGKSDQSLLGPVYLPATNGSSHFFREAKRQAYDEIQTAIKTGHSKYGKIDNEETSFSVQVFSTLNNETLFDFHFEAPKLNGSYTKGKLSDQTVYRTGSLGKLMAVYAILVDIGDHVFLDPVTKYVVSTLTQGLFYSLN